MKHGFLRVVATSIFAVGSLGLGSSESAQNAGRAEDEASLRSGECDVICERFTIEGIVLEADGAPAVGACVTTSAGGRAVADANGRYRLEVGVASGATNVQVTATGASGVNRVASAIVVLPARTAPVQVGSLVLLKSVTCEPSWVPTFGEQAGVNGAVRALATYDDGSGPALYVGGSIIWAGGVEALGIARWNGSSWTSPGALESLPSNGAVADGVFAMVVHDDGSGPALFVGGRFQTAGGVVVNNIAKWDGSSWSALAGGTSGPFGSAVLALTVFDDGSGSALYACGEFTSAGGVAAARVAKWNGSSWTALGPGLNGGMTFPPVVNALAVCDDGNGPKLYAGGSFGLAGGVTVTNVARWDGSSWSALGSGLNNFVCALAAYDDGSGTALYAGGRFGLAGGLPANRIAKWNGSSWQPLGSGMNEIVRSLCVHDDGGGSALYAAGDFEDAGGGSAKRIARWNGTSWQAVGGGLLSINGTFAGWGYAMAAFDDGGGTALFAGGNFSSAGGTPARSIARWNGSSWAALGGGPNWLNDAEVLALAEYDDGAGQRFTPEAGSPAQGVRL